MGVDVALTAGEQTALAGNDTIKRYLSTVANQEVANATVDAISVPFPIGYIPVTGTSVNWLTAIKPGMTFRVMDATETTLRGYYRVRYAPPSTATLPCMEISSGDPGLLAQSSRFVGITATDKIRVYERYDLWSSMPRIFNSNFYEDYFLLSEWKATFADLWNNAPPCVLNLGQHRNVDVDAGQTYATLTFTANTIFWLAGQAVTSYNWTIPASWTVTVGTANTQSFTARVPVGQYVLYHRLRNNGGQDSYARRVVWVYDAATRPLGMDAIASDVRDRTGRKMTVSLIDNDLASVTDGAMVYYREQCTWNSGDVATATKGMVGWIIREPWDIQLNTRKAQAEIVGPAELLRMLGGYSFYLEENATPGTFYQVVTGLSDVNYLIWLLLKLRAPNVLELFDHNPFNSRTATADKNYLTAHKVNSGNLLSQVQGLAKSMGCNYGHSSDGSAWITRNPSLHNSTVRATTPERDDLTTARYTAPVSPIREMKPRLRKMRGEAFYNNAGDIVVTYDAPGAAPGQGPLDERLEGLVLPKNGTDASYTNAIVELGYLTENAFAQGNNPYQSVPVHIPYNRDVYEPAQETWVRFRLDAADAPDGVAWNNRGCPQRVTKIHEPGLARVELDLEMETLGTVPH